MMCITFQKIHIVLQVYCLTHIILTFSSAIQKRGGKIGHKIQIMAYSVKFWVTFKIEFPEFYIHLRNGFIVLIKRFLNFLDQLPLHTERKAITTWDCYCNPPKLTRLTSYKGLSEQSKLPSKWRWHFVKWINEQRKNYSFTLCHIKNPMANYSVYLRIELIIMTTFGYMSPVPSESLQRGRRIFTLRFLFGWEQRTPLKKAVHPWEMWFPFARPLFIFCG